MNRKLKIAVFGGSFNPPGIHHRKIAEILSKQFDRVIIVPCGHRPDKPMTSKIAPIHRAVMCDMTFADLPKVEVDHFDLEGDTFTRTHKLDDRYSKQGEVWHVVGADIVKGGGNNESLIHRVWENTNF